MGFVLGGWSRFYFLEDAYVCYGYAVFASAYRCYPGFFGAGFLSSFIFTPLAKATRAGTFGMIELTKYRDLFSDQ